MSLMGHEYPQQVWKGTIEYKDGIKIIKNPNTPIYGEIDLKLEQDLKIGDENDKNSAFYRRIEIAVDSQGNIFVLDTGNHRIQKFNREGKHLLTVGRKGQGPGEFSFPSALFIAKDGTIYVKDSNFLHIFDQNGLFMKSLSFQNAVGSFGLLEDFKFLMEVTSFTSKGRAHEIAILNQKGEKEKAIESYTEEIYGVKKSGKVSGGVIGGVIGGVFHGYTHNLMLVPLKIGGGIFGHSKEYTLTIIDPSGEIDMVINKIESPKMIPQKEKNRLIESNYQSLKKRGFSKSDVEKMLNLPDYEPFFSDFIRDDEGILYVIKKDLPSKNEKSIPIDIFDREGRYIYKTIFPFNPKVIQNGFAYTTKLDPETHYIRILRYKITNWDKLRGLNPPS